MHPSKKPLLAVTMGDPAGIGPEVVARAWLSPEIHRCARLFAVGEAQVFRRAGELIGADFSVRQVERDAIDPHLESDSRTMICCSTRSDSAAVPPGQIDARAGAAAFEAVQLAARMAIERHIDGLVTAPLSKAALQAAGHAYPGHTELLAEMCGVSDFAMMLYLPPGEAVHSPHGLGVAHVTLHQSLRTVAEALTPDGIVAKCHLANRVMRELGVDVPRIAVCALNPHAGEQGLFGDEEAQIIAPAVKVAQNAGMRVTGPFPTDTLMVRARDGEFDAVVAMYHDQGHIALKLLGMHAAVNITAGLPIVRTSVAHGTAFDRAWRGTARAEGMVAAISTAASLATARRDSWS